jgi:hypothetical protein
MLGLRSLDMIRDPPGIIRQNLPAVLKIVDERTQVSVVFST